MRRTRGAVSRKLICSTEPLITLEDGTPIYPIMGSDPEGQEGQGDEDQDGDGDAEDEDEEDSEDSEDEDEKPKSKSKRKPKETPEQKVRRLNRENQERRLALEAAEKKLREIEDKGKSELEITKRDLEELREKTKGDAETLNKLRIENAFLKLSGYNWHDPEDALDRILRDPDVVINDDGSVDGLKEVVKDLAAKKPYLLKAREEDDEDKGSRRNGTSSRGSSGAGVGSGPKSRKSQDKAAQREKLIAKYGLGDGR